MQYYVNGFQPGDPDVQPAAPDHRRAGDPLPQAVDVLIAGSGPAGLCLAAQLARVPQIRTMLVEPKLEPMVKSQADGISVRSMEMFQAFGFGEKVMREAAWIVETTFWAPGADAPLERVARVHDMFLDIMHGDAAHQAWGVMDMLAVTDFPDWRKKSFVRSQSEDIFAMRGIDRAAGCMVVVRPDQYVGHVLPLSARDELAAYFVGVLRVRD